MSCAGGSSMIYQLSDDSTSSILFTRVWQGPPTMDLYPVMIAQPTGALVIMADAPVTTGSNTSPSPTLWQMSSLGTSDFVPRSVCTRRRYKIFIAMQPLKLEMIQDNCTTLQNFKQHELCHSRCHSGILKTHAHIL